MSDKLREVHEHYLLDREKDRLTSPLGRLEYLRTLEVMARHLPPPPAVVADIGGGPGAYALHLASGGYRVVHRDLVPLHVDHLKARATSAGLIIDSGVCDARRLDIPTSSADAVLLLGPLYHLPRRADRLLALREAGRIVRPGSVIFVAAISRWAPRLHGEIVARLAETRPDLHVQTLAAERSGVLPALFPGSFAGYCHRPQQLRAEIRAAGLECLDLVGVEGIGFALADLEGRLGADAARKVVLDAARDLERVPELLGLSPHLLATARRPIASTN